MYIELDDPIKEHEWTDFEKVNFANWKRKMEHHDNLRQLCWKAAACTIHPGTEARSRLAEESILVQNNSYAVLTNNPMTPQEVTLVTPTEYVVLCPGAALGLIQLLYDTDEIAYQIPVAQVSEGGVETLRRLRLCGCPYMAEQHGKMVMSIRDRAHAGCRCSGCPNANQGETKTEV
jgi:hypothetical protein